MKENIDFKKVFPQLNITLEGNPFVYLDNAATSLKHIDVIKTLEDEYLYKTSNIHRGIHHFGSLGSLKYEETRKAVANFIHAKSNNEIIFTKGTTDSINIVAQSFLEKNNLILSSTLEHHANIVPWQLHGILKEVPLLDDFSIDKDAYKKLLLEKPKVVSFTMLSNVIGVKVPIKELCALAHEAGALFLADCAQAAPHMPLDVKDLDVDFLVFSGHKLYGPFGVGILYGKEKILQRMRPADGGGGMIDQVSFEKSTWADLPYKLEAGTPVVSEVIAFKKSLEFIQNLSFSEIAKRENDLLSYAKKELSQIREITMFLPKEDQHSSIISFVFKGLHASDLAHILDKQGIAIRSGHHCAMPLLKHIKETSLARISFAPYNTKEDIDRLKSALKKATEFA